MICDWTYETRDHTIISMLQPFGSRSMLSYFSNGTGLAPEYRTNDRVLNCIAWEPKCLHATQNYPLLITSISASPVNCHCGRSSIQSLTDVGRNVVNKLETWKAHISRNPDLNK
jgi:hypothetical protein